MFGSDTLQSQQYRERYLYIFNNIVNNRFNNGRVTVDTYIHPGTATITITADFHVIDGYRAHIYLYPNNQLSVALVGNLANSIHSTALGYNNVYLYFNNTFDIINEITRIDTYIHEHTSIDREIIKEISYEY
jgi:hypothetical protein